MSKINVSHLNSGTAQTERIDPKQVKNSAGGYVYQVSDLDRLRRFLTLGVEGGTYYVSEKKLTKDNAQALSRLLKSDGLAYVDEVVKFSVGGRAAKQAPTLFALALAAREGNDETRKAAISSLKSVCRTPTMLFNFIEYYTALGASKGWGRSMRRNVADWYNSKSVNDLIYHVTKYQQRDGWSNKDMLRLSHPAAPTADHNLVYNWITKGEVSVDAFENKEVGQRLDGVMKCLTATDAAICVNLIKKFDLVQEHVPSALMKDKAVNMALLEKMPLTAMIRNLGRLTSVGVLAPLSDGTSMVVKALGNEVALKKARVHPFNVLTALLTYNSGHGAKGNLSWTPVPQVVEALGKAFYKSFDNVESTGKKFLIAMDVSGSMTWTDMMGVPGLTPSVGCAALAMTIARTEPNSHITAFSSTMKTIDINASTSLEVACKKVREIGAGGTDCALPMYWALDNNINADVFVVLTDNDTWSGRRGHPSEALKEYRRKVNPDAKLVVIGMQATEFSIADPADPGMLDIAGFDGSTPDILHDFALGKI